MNRVAATVSLCAVLYAYSPGLLAQQELEPGVQTSSSAAPAAVSAPASPATHPATPTGASPTAAPVAAKTATQPGRPKTPQAAAAASTKADKAPDHLNLDTTQVSGNRELPKVMYVVPWRKAELGDYTGRPPNSLLDEALTPIDRDVFKRQNRYFATLQQQAAPAKSQPDAAAGAAVPPRPEDEK